MTHQTTAGQRVALVHCNDPHTKLKQGDTGTVRFVDDLGTVHVKWDNGASLGLVEADGDRWVVIAPAQMSQPPEYPFSPKHKGEALAAQTAKTDAFVAELESKS